ncbi:MAG: histidine--tRNA ligase [Verrucomicrobiota bacterium]|nr:histidine--tRNA ligase [Verrucomicrobiota bacterium]
MQLLPGFRDFYPDDCARRNYIFAMWREVARRYGFVEYDGPILETHDLYRKKSGGEIAGQLFEFTDKGEREVALRPEMTPTLARMVAARARDFRKPLRWFSIGQFFRYEKQQRGRSREFYQLNCDILGEDALGSDAEAIALMIDSLREFGFTSGDVAVRISDRRAWEKFLSERGRDVAELADFLQVIDKLERVPDAVSDEKLRAFGTSLDDVRAFAAQANLDWFGPLRAELDARGVADFVEYDLKIVRGLAYYTGLVFEIFDRKKTLRALAGGGRYDQLLGLLSDGATTLPALGFAMGDVVLAELIKETPAAAAKMDAWISREHAIEIYVVIAKEERRADALAAVQKLRNQGCRVDFPLAPAKVGRQFQNAELLGAKTAVLFGDEWPSVKIKTLATREEIVVPHTELLEHARRS